MGEVRSLCQEAGRGDKRPSRRKRRRERQRRIEPVSLISEKGLRVLTLCLSLLGLRSHLLMAGICDEQQWLLLSCPPGGPSLPSGSQPITFPNAMVHMPCAVRHTYATPSQRSYVDSRKASPKLRGGVYSAVLEGKQPRARRLSVL